MHADQSPRSGMHYSRNRSESYQTRCASDLKAPEQSFITELGMGRLVRLRSGRRSNVRLGSNRAGVSATSWSPKHALYLKILLSNAMDKDKDRCQEGTVCLRWEVELDRAAKQNDPDLMALAEAGEIRVWAQCRQRLSVACK